MLWHQTVRYLLFNLLVGGHVYVEAAGPMPIPAGNLSPPTLQTEWFPTNAPERPWNQHTCRHPQVPNVHLTFGYGAPLPPTRLLRVIDKAKARMREDMDEGIAQAIEDLTVVPAGDTITTGDVIIAAQPADRPSPRYPRPEFKLTDAIKAIKLIQHCSLAMGRSEGIWAQAYVHGVLVGYIWTVAYFPEPPPH